MGEGRGTVGRGGARLPLVAAACVMAGMALFATGLPALESEVLPDAAHRRWSGVLDQHTLGDGSVLSVYTAYTTATDTEDVALRIGFVPRFDCSSMMGIRFGGTMASVIEAFFEDGNSVMLDIDGEAFEWPLMVDADGVATTLWLNGEAGRRESARGHIDAGSRASLALPNTVSVTFSLLGSRNSTGAAEAACRAHEPIPWNG